MFVAIDRIKCTAYCPILRSWWGAAMAGMAARRPTAHDSKKSSQAAGRAAVMKERHGHDG
jgi:hypothetical protein